MWVVSISKLSDDACDIWAVYINRIQRSWEIYLGCMISKP